MTIKENFAVSRYTFYFGLIVIWLSTELNLISHYFHKLLDLSVTVESILCSMKTSPHFTFTTKLFPDFPSIFLIIPVSFILLWWYPNWFSPWFKSLASSLISLHNLILKIIFTRSSHNTCKALCKSTNGDNISYVWIFKNCNSSYFCGLYLVPTHIPTTQFPGTSHMTSRIKTSCL